MTDVVASLPSDDILAIAALVLEARIAQARDDWTEAARALAQRIGYGAGYAVVQAPR